MVLDRLPSELQIEVLRHLRVARNYRDLASVALCSPHYYDLTVPILYSEFEARVLSTPSFLRTILDRPDLALYVKRLTGYIPNEGSVWSTRPRERIDARLRRAIAKACDDKRLREKWYTDFYDRDYPEIEHIWGNILNWDAVTALLLLYLPNVTALRIPFYTGRSEPSHQKPVFIPFVFRRAAQLHDSGVQSAYSLSKLRQLEITVDDEADLISLESIYPVLSLRSIQQVRCPHTICHDKGLDYGKEVAPMPHVTHLSFPESDIHTVALERFLRPFTRLTHFSYVLYCEDEPYPFLPHIMWNGLVHLKDTLQELILVDGNEEYQQMDMYDSSGRRVHEPENGIVLPLGSLAEFRCLRRLEVTAVILTGRENVSEKGLEMLDINIRKTANSQRVANSLPGSLEELVLHSCDSEIYGTIDALFKTIQLGGLRRLKTITLLFLEHFTSEQIRMDEKRLACEIEGKDIAVTVSRLGPCQEDITFKILD